MTRWLTAAVALALVTTAHGQGDQSHIPIPGGDDAALARRMAGRFAPVDKNLLEKMLKEMSAEQLRDLQEKFGRGQIADILKDPNTRNQLKELADKYPQLKDKRQLEQLRE